MKKPESIKNLDSITVCNRENAWKIIHRVFDTYYHHDANLSNLINHDVFTSCFKDEQSTVIDFGSMMVITYIKGDVKETFTVFIG